MLGGINLVYRLPVPWEISATALPSGIECIPAEADSVNRLFESNLVLKKTFLAFLEDHFWGVFLQNDASWVGYAWMSRPISRGPRHLAPPIQRLPVYWICYCRTQEAYRGLGMYKYALQVLIRHAMTEDSALPIYIDTEITNKPARRAILRTGFRACGIVVTVRVPKVNLMWGRWFPHFRHPGL